MSLLYRVREADRAIEEVEGSVVVVVVAVKITEICLNDYKLSAGFS